MIYYELIEGTKTHTNNFVAVSDLKTSPRSCEAYCSLFGYGQEILEFVKLHQTVSGYNGDYYLKTFFFDIDCEDLNKAKDSAIELIRKLNKDYKIDPNQLIIYFSGGKGFHIGLHDKMFGGFPPLNDLPEQTKELAIELSKGIPHIDNKIYSKNRFFRLPNSKHAESGLYKIPLYFDDLNLWPIEDVLKKAKEPRKGFSSRVDYKAILVNEKLESLWTMIRNRPSGQALKMEYKQKGSAFKVPEKGERNDILFKQAIKLFKNSTLDFDSILNIIATINMASDPPLEEIEVFAVVKSAEKYKEEGETESKHKYKFFVDYVNQWIEYISPTKRKLTLCFDSIDKDIKGKLEGKLIAMMGKGGSKKTLYAENIIVENIAKHSARCIFSQMDMGDLELISRFINHIGDAGDIPIAESLEKLEIETPGAARVWLEDEPVKFYSDKLVVTSQSNMEAKNYDSLIEDITRRHGKVDFLIVDSLSKMGGSGGETERYSKNTKELKELTIKWGVCVILLCHTTKACEKWYRDCSRYVRGSEKILDDCDMQISISQILDPGTAKDDSPEFITDKGMVQYYNKRGTGKNIRKVFDFDTMRLLMKESSDNPWDHECKTNQSKSKFNY